MATETRKDLIGVGVLWAVLTIIGELVVLNMNILPTLASKQGEESDKAVELLFVYTVPVMAVVLAVLFYSLARWRVSEPTEDGPPIADHRGFSRAWFWISVALATLVFFYPGLSGIRAMAEAEEVDLIVSVEGVQWHWDIGFPEHAVSLENPDELVLPAGSTIRFDMTSVDVIHSFWVPAFRLKQDAIPGQTNSVTITLLEDGSYETDDAFRLQCAELCGTGHARMFLPVRVVSEDEFREWLSGVAEAGSMGDMNMTDGEMTDGEMTDGEMTDGEMTDGEMTDGEMTDGEMTDEDGEG
jgi:cytochrome c oxidase subunit II